MYLNQFSVSVVGGSEVAGGYVEIEHGRTYKLRLRNDRLKPCDAEVEIDGKPVGIWRIWAASTIAIERPVSEASLFTAYLLRSEEGGQAGLDPNNDKLGLIQVKFMPGDAPKPPQAVREPYTLDWSNQDNVATASMPVADGNSRRVTALYSGSASAGVASSAAPADYSPVGTGLSGHSNQWFNTVQPLIYDASQQTTISLRLVRPRSPGQGPHPLPSSANPVPPRPL